MKAISLKQPWANMVVSGKKTIETRKWKTKYRGPLLIVSSKEPQIEPFGYALGVVDVLDCVKMMPEHEEAACIEVYDKAQAWFLENPRHIHPFPVGGKLNVYDVELPWAIEVFYSAATPFQRGQFWGAFVYGHRDHSTFLERLHKHPIYEPKDGALYSGPLHDHLRLCGDQQIDLFDGEPIPVLERIYERCAQDAIDAFPVTIVYNLNNPETGT